MLYVYFIRLCLGSFSVLFSLSSSVAFMLLRFVRVFVCVYATKLESLFTAQISKHDN